MSDEPKPAKGWGRWLRLAAVVLPLLFPAIVAGSIFTFSLTLGDYITVNISEGEQYSISEVKLAGGLSAERDVSLRSGRRVAEALRVARLEGQRAVGVDAPDDRLYAYVTGNQPGEIDEHIGRIGADDLFHRGTGLADHVAPHRRVRL